MYKRQSNGRVKDYSVDVSTDGEKWQPAAKGSFPDSADLQLSLIHISMALPTMNTNGR